MTLCMKIVHKKNRTSEKIGFTCHAVGTESYITRFGALGHRVIIAEKISFEEAMKSVVNTTHYTRSSVVGYTASGTLNIAHYARHWARLHCHPSVWVPGPVTDLWHADFGWFDFLFKR